MAVPQQNPYQQNPYGQNSLMQGQAPQAKKFSIPTWVFWAAVIGILGIASFLIFF